MASKNSQKKRFWSDEEKNSICFQARAPGVSVAQVARRYAMNANMIHKWLRDPRFSSPAEVMDLPEAEDAAFLPIEVAGTRAVPTAPMSPCFSTSCITAQRVDITLSDGRRILVEGGTALPAIVALIEGLAR